MHADKAGSWDNLHERFEVERFDREEARSLDGTRPHQAKEHVGRLRRAEIGIHHHVAGVDRLRDAQDSARREDDGCVSDGDRVSLAWAVRLEFLKSCSPRGRAHRCRQSSSLREM
ncbi:hypothetical protein [Bradyrhizobium sp.]|uniref:hypothetical protein n=1 Tax=Bradyrhizobium sp. TaxID=376 RepID=UPI003C6EA5FE